MKYKRNQLVLITHCCNKENSCICKEAYPEYSSGNIVKYYGFENMPNPHAIFLIDNRIVINVLEVAPITELAKVLYT